MSPGTGAEHHQGLDRRLRAQCSQAVLKPSGVQASAERMHIRKRLRIEPGDCQRLKTDVSGDSHLSTLTAIAERHFYGAGLR